MSIYSRYSGIETVEIDGEVSLAQRPPALEEDMPDSLIHTCVGRETLDELARTYYGREDLWWRIADANPRRFPFDWQPGETLIIPPIRIATRTVRR